MAEEDKSTEERLEAAQRWLTIYSSMEPLPVVLAQVEFYTERVEELERYIKESRQ